MSICIKPCLCLCLTIGALAASASRAAENPIDDAIEAMNELGSALFSAKNEELAKAAAPKIAEAFKKLSAANVALGALPPDQQRPTSVEQAVRLKDAVAMLYAGAQRVEMTPKTARDVFNFNPSQFLAAEDFILIATARTDGSLREIRMARNEQSAVASCRAFLSAQNIYRRTDWDKDKFLEYAQRLGANDKAGLLNTKGIETGLIDKAFAAAELLPGGKATPKNGYYFKVLTKSEKAIERSYVYDGRMTSGCALLAWPAEYGVTGRNTFQISDAGTVYQADLGKDTAIIAEKWDSFKVELEWTVTD